MGGGKRVDRGSYRQICNSRVPRHLLHDHHLSFQQRSYSVVARNGRAVVREDDARLGLVIRWDFVVEGCGRKFESACDISAVIMLSMLDWSRASCHVAGDSRHESEVFDGLQRF